MPAPVAEITALRRLEGLEFTVKSASLSRLFNALSQGATARSNSPRRRPGVPSGEDLIEPPPNSPRITPYSGATHRYELPLVENGIPRQLAGFSAGRFDLWGSPELILNRGPRLNLSFLTAVGTDIPEGASIVIPTVVSDKLLTEFLEGVQGAIRQLYIDYIADRRHTINIVSEHAIA